MITSNDEFRMAGPFKQDLDRSRSGTEISRRRGMEKGFRACLCLSSFTLSSNNHSMMIDHYTLEQYQRANAQRLPKLAI